MEFGGCGNDTDFTIGTTLDQCFRCENSDTKEVRGCKVTYDYNSQMANYTTYQSLTCDDTFYWMDKSVSSFPTNECVWGSYRVEYKIWSNSYAYPYRGITTAYYNDSSCDQAPIYYSTMRSSQTSDNGELCFVDDKGSFGVTKGCDFVNYYHSDDCSGPAYVIVPTKQDVGVCSEDEQTSLYFPSYHESYEIMTDHSVNNIRFCENGPADRPPAVCMNEGGLPCQDIFQKGLEAFVGVPSSTARVCKPDKNDDELKIEFAHFARDPMTYHGMARVTVRTPDDVSSMDRFRVVMKVYADGQKEKLGSFKFNGRPENNSLTFQWEGPYPTTFEPREMTVKIKQRVYNETRAFVRKSCVRTEFPHDDEEEDYDGMPFDHHDNYDHHDAK